jgi:hypothetical protein
MITGYRSPNPSPSNFVASDSYRSDAIGYDEHIRIHLRRRMDRPPMLQAQDQPTWQP